MRRLIACCSPRLKSWVTVGIMLICSIAFAQETDSMEFRPELGIKGVAGKIGALYLIDNYGFAPGFGLWADLGTISPSIALDGGVEYWNGGKLESDGGTTRKSNISIYLTLKLKIDMEKIHPFLGAGLGVNMYSKIYPENWDQPDEKNTNLEPHIDMGAVYNLHPKLDLEARLKANFSDISAYGIYVSGIFRLGVQ